MTIAKAAGAKSHSSSTSLQSLIIFSQVLSLSLSLSTLPSSDIAEVVKVESARENGSKICLAARVCCRRNRSDSAAAAAAIEVSGTVHLQGSLLNYIATRIFLQRERCSSHFSGNSQAASRPFYATSVATFQFKCHHTLVTSG